MKLFNYTFQKSSTSLFQPSYLSVHPLLRAAVRIVVSRLQTFITFLASKASSACNFPQGMKNFTPCLARCLSPLKKLGCTHFVGTSQQLLPFHFLSLSIISLIIHTSTFCLNKSFKPELSCHIAKCSRESNQA